MKRADKKECVKGLKTINEIRILECKIHTAVISIVIKAIRSVLGIGTGNIKI